MVIIYLGKETNRILEIMDSLSLSYRVVGDLQKGLPMKELLKTERTSSGKGNGFLYLYEEPETNQQRLAEALKKEEIFIPRVAVNTENNINWTLEYLMEIVEQEYEYYALKEKIYDIITHPDKTRLKADPFYRKRMVRAYSLLEDPETTLEQLQETYLQIQPMKS